MAKKKKSVKKWEAPKVWNAHITVELPSAVQTPEELAKATISLHAVPETAWLGKAFANLQQAYPKSKIGEIEIFATCECPNYVQYVHNPGTCEWTKYILGPCGPECNCDEQ